MSTKSYYIYIYLNTLKPGNYRYEIPDEQDLVLNFEPFYVGKGSGKRFQDHLFINQNTVNNRNRMKRGTIKKIIEKTSKFPEIFFYKKEILNPVEALQLEVELISIIGRRDLGKGPLTNMTDGGDGVVNYKITQDDRLKNSESHKKVAKLGKENHSSKEVYQYNLDGSFVRKWDCIEDCNREFGFQSAHIISCTKGRCKTSYGYQWFKEYQGESVKAVTKGKKKSEGYLEIKDKRNGKRTRIKHGE